ncbi:hypothetical protein HBI26_104030 [Parastagonospora nodorum]|nr:hypothetical protein HBH52_142940 [Parastagonospora nodorum]KAH4004504.1 hypothetical protein HBI10_049850 [Parastagonospora nodorum]KAH4268340.1 hypothetical protein HBI03_057790 [Parastagonospora nodorum]KAH4279033.1 hypothetical protein HBI04_073240 [Parastagonospora nodorum]KAH4734322.1 hypothetical protein HBH78_002690 [Parastagonospora nodorum]
MEVSSLLVDTYKRYKKGSAIVVSWMATTAAKYQNIDHLLVKGPRLKGKARIDARQANGSIRHAKIPLSSFHGLVAILSKAGIKMSQNIEIILWDVIKARKECAAFYRYQPEKSKENTKTDEGHQYFIDILQHAYITLKRPGHDARSTATDCQPQIYREDPSNIFAYLYAEEIEDAEDTVPISGASYLPVQATRSTKYVIEQSPEQRQQERSFAVFCFLEDLIPIRLFVHRSWREWKERRVTLATASVTANVVIEILRLINEAFLIDYPDFNTHNKVVEALLYLNDWTHTDNPSISKDISRCQTAEAEQSHMKHCLKAFITMMRIETIEGITVQQHDLLIKAVKAAGSQGHAPSWVVLAFQVFIDMHRELGSRVRRGYKKLLETSDRLRVGLEAHIDFTKSYSDRVGHLWYDRCKSEVENLLQAMASGAEVSFFENHPAACGTTIESFSPRCIFSALSRRQGVSKIFVGERPTDLGDCSQNATNRGLTPLQTLSIYHDAMKADELALGFDTMTLGIIAMQILRIVSNTIDRANTVEADILHDSYTCFAVDAFLSSSIPQDPFYGIVGTHPKAWSLIQQIIERVALLRNPTHEAEFASTAAIFGGPNSTESPNDWINTWDLPSTHEVYEYRALASDFKTEELILEDQARDEFMQSSSISLGRRTTWKGWRVTLGCIFGRHWMGLFGGENSSEIGLDGCVVELGWM